MTKSSSSAGSRSAPSRAASTSPGSGTGRAPRSRSTRAGERRRPRTFSSYSAALKHLADRTNVERVRPDRVDPSAFKLDRMRALLAELGDPHRATKFVHIAGSKGKGSVTEMVASSLRACGYGVGVYTSPHLIDVRERIRIGNDEIGEADFIRLLGKAVTAAEHLLTKPGQKKLGEATYFELLTAVAFLYFAEQAVDLAVVEVGLGGRLDATNVITPEVAAVAAIQLEHTELLGETLGEIAREKAGIFKEGVKALTFKQPGEVLEALKAAATERGAVFKVVGKDIDFSYRFEASPELGPHARVVLSTAISNFEHLPTPLKGEHQALNCGLALAVLDALRERGFAMTERQVAEGLAATPQRGRMEMAWPRPRILLDGAHTPESVEALVRAIGAHIRYDSMVVIFGCSADKRLDAMLEKVGLGADKIIFTKSRGNPRAAEPAELQKRFAELSPKMTQTEPTLESAIQTAVRAVAHGDLIVVTGSFYLVGEAKSFLAERAARRAETKPAAPDHAKPDAGVPS